MPEIQDIHSIASQWLERFGDDALEQLNQRLAELEQHNEVEAHALWVKIQGEVQKLIAEKKTTD